MYLKKMNVFSIFIIILVGLSSFATQNISATIKPNSAESEELDFLLIESHENLYEDLDLLEIIATIRSPSGYLPTTVIGNIQGMNYSLEVSYMGSGNNISEEMDFMTMISLPIDGNYSIEYFAGNISGLVSIGIVSFEINRKFEQDIWEHQTFNAHHGCVYNNYYQFFIQEYFINDSIPEAILTLDGVNNTMIYEKNFDFGESWMLLKDFGIDDERLHIYNITLRWGNSYFHSNTNSFNTTKTAREQSISLNWYQMNENDNLNWMMYINYQNWENVSPYQIFVEINGINKSLEVNNLEYANAEISEHFNTYCNPIRVLDFRNGVRMGPYLNVLNCIYGSAYNVSVWINNGSKWFEYPIYDNITFNPTIIYPAANFTTEILNQTIFIENGSTKINYTINVISNDEIVVFPQINVNSFHPEFKKKNCILYQENNSDIEYSNGKIYSGISIIDFSSERNLSEIYGDLEYLYDFDYSYYYNTSGILKLISKSFKSSFITIDFPNAPSGELNIVPGDWFIYLLEMHENNGAIEHQYNLRLMYEIIEVGTYLNYDYVDYKEYWWDECDEKWDRYVYGSIDLPEFRYPIQSEFDIFNQPKYYLREYLNPNNEYSSDFFVVYDGVLEKKYEYLIEKTEPGYYSIDENTISSSHSWGLISLETELTYENGVLVKDSFIGNIRNNINYVKYERLLYVAGTGELPIDDGTTERQRQDESKVPIKNEISSFPMEIILGLTTFGIAVVVLQVQKRTQK